MSKEWHYNDLSLGDEVLTGDALVDHLVAVKIGLRSAAGYVFRAAYPEEVIAFHTAHPEAYDNLRRSIIDSLDNQNSGANVSEYDASSVPDSNVA